MPNEGKNMKKNILIIDDEEMITVSLQKLLDREGYHVVTANEVAVALQKIKDADFDLIVSDVRMPDVDGIKGIQKIRNALKRSEKPAVPEILITGYADLDKYEKAMRLDVTEYLYKPFDNSEFLRIVKRILNP